MAAAVFVYFTCTLVPRFFLSIIIVVIVIAIVSCRLLYSYIVVVVVVAVVAVVVGFCFGVREGVFFFQIDPSSRLLDRCCLGGDSFVWFCEHCFFRKK